VAKLGRINIQAYQIKRKPGILKNLIYWLFYLNPDNQKYKGGIVAHCDNLYIYQSELPPKFIANYTQKHKSSYELFWVNQKNNMF